MCCCEAFAGEIITIPLQVVIEKSKLRVGVKGLTAVLDGDLYAAVKPDDSFWNSDGTALEITLQKATSFLSYCTYLSCHSAITHGRTMWRT